MSEIEKNMVYIGIDIGISNIAIYSDKGLRYVGASAETDSSESHPAHVREPVISLLSGSMKASESIRHLLEERINDAQLSQPAQNIYAMVTVDHDAPDSYKRNILEIANKVFKGAMVVNKMFCVAYKTGKTEASIYVDIGTANTRICCIDGDVPESLSCTSIDSGGNDIERELLDLITAEHEDISLTKEIVREWIVSHSYVGESEGKTKVKVPVDNKMSESGSKSDMELDITEELALASEYMVSDVISGVTRMISSMDPKSRNIFRNNIYLCGGGSKIRNIVCFMENELKELGGGKVFLVDDPVFAGAMGAWMLAAKMPKEFWLQLEEQENTKRKV